MEKIKVKNFGKIKEAEIELNKMMLFVGDNNSGKSYMASLIYGLYNHFNFSNSKVFSNKSSLVSLKSKIKNLILTKSDTNEIDFNDEIINIEKAINQYLKDENDNILRNIFSYDVKADEIEIELDKGDALTLELKFTSENQFRSEIFNGFVVLPWRHDLDKDDVEDIADDIINNIVFTYFVLSTNYLPVSRTGFMLSYKTLVSDALNVAYSAEIQKPRTVLTKPTNDFLRALSTINVTNDWNKLDDIVSFIEDNVINGKVTVTQSPTPDYLYTPKGTDQMLPMNVSSGVVTEMTPLLLFMKHLFFTRMIIEEPEMCLHPKLQWSLTRALIKATHLDKSFLLTTHSEAIVSHINDMIKLNNHEDRDELMAEFGYKKDDLISENDVNIYQFLVDDNDKTDIEKLEYTEDGFIVTTFIDNLRDRLKESRAFEN